MNTSTAVWIGLGVLGVLVVASMDKTESPKPEIKPEIKPDDKPSVEPKKVIL